MNKNVSFSEGDRFRLKAVRRQVPCLSTPSLEYHGAYVLIYILEGNGLCQVDSALYRFAPGDALMVRPNEAYCCFGTDHQSYTAFEMTLDNSAFQPFRDSDALRPLLSPWNKDPFVHRKTLGVSEKRTMDVLMQQMLSCCSPGENLLPESCRNALLSGLAGTMLAFLQGVYSIRSDDPVDDKPSDHMVTRAIQYISMNYDQDLTLDSIARYLYVNPSYLSHVFRKVTGDTLTAYINKRRIHQARYYLSSTTLRITRIAELVGFNSAPYFNVVFKTYEGCTPQAYRKNNSQNSTNQTDPAE